MAPRLGVTSMVALLLTMRARQVFAVLDELKIAKSAENGRHPENYASGDD